MYKLLQASSGIWGAHNLFELEWLEKLAYSSPKPVRIQKLAEVTGRDRALPIWAFEIGPQDPTRPLFILVAGVHGLERISTHIALAWLGSVFERLRWDKDYASLFSRVRVAVIPLLNPVGMLQGTRSNGNGVDLMRNAPVDAAVRTPWLVGGHRLGPWLPWYRGEAEKPMETEAQTLIDFVQSRTLRSTATVSLDIHSGFGRQDRIWTPYARTRDTFPDIDAAMRIKHLLDDTYPNHVYEFEQQSQSYTASGDLWDYLYDRHPRGADVTEVAQNIFIPLTLEMGSWTWLRKNPRQIFSSFGAFNPMMPHRYERILRRHLILLEFLVRATRNYKQWIA